MTTLIRNPRVRESLGNFVLVFLSVGIVVLYSSYQRPIWLDEFLQFAFGAYSLPVFPVALGEMFATAGGFGRNWTNFAGNGMFFSLLQYPFLLLLSDLSLAVRAPSWIAALLTLVGSFVFMRSQGFSTFWQATSILSLGASSFLFYYGGEARSYMLLTVGTVWALCYFSAENLCRNRLFQTTCWIFCMTAALGHSYFILYFFSLFVFWGGVVLWHSGIYHLKEYLRRVNYWFIGTVFAGAVAVNAFGFVGDAQKLAYDVFEFLRPNGGFVKVWVDTHFQALPLPGRFAWIALSALGVLCLLFLYLRIKGQSQARELAVSLLPPVGLIVLALFLAALLSWVSSLAGYWILNRQWVASLALVPIGTVWFLAALYTFLKPRMKWAAYGLAAASFLVIGAMAAYRLYGQVGALQSYATTAAEYREKYAGVTIADSQRLYDELGPVEAANVNIYLGGPVWPVFSCTYGCEEGYQD